MSWLVLLGWTLASFLGLNAVLYGLALFRGGALDIVSLGGAEALVYISCTFLVLLVHDRGGALRNSLGLRPTHPGLALGGVGLGLCLKIPVESLAAYIEAWFPNTDQELLSRATLYRTENLGDVLGLLAILCVVAPLVEELLFRGALYGRLARLSPVQAGVGSGLAFVLVHPDPRHFLPLILVAAALSYLRVVSGSLLPGLCLHVAFNSAGVLALVAGWASPTRSPSVPAPLLVGSWITAFVLLLLLLRLADKPDVVRARLEDRA